jgi:CelD/BcsL family acetyltransferase involved in cellulose biosynthesis
MTTVRLKKKDDRLAALVDHLSAEMLTSEEEFIRIRDEWNELFNLCKSPCVFQSFTWNYTWWKYLGKSFTLAIVIVREDGNLVGVGPFIVKKRFSVPEIQPIGALEYLGLLLDDDREDVAQVIASKLSEAFPKGVVHIRNYAAGNFGVDVFIASMMAEGWKEQRWVRDISHYIYCKDGFSGYLATKSRKSRRNLRYNRTKLERKGKVIVTHFQGLELTEETVVRIAQIQQRSWLLRRGAGYIGTAFYRELLPALAQQGLAELFILSIDTEDVAFILNFCSGDTHYAISTAFNEKFDDVSPGQILWLDCIKSILDRNNRIYDLPFGDAKYKRFWCNRTKRVFRLVCYRGLKGWILSWFPHRLHGTFARYAALRGFVGRMKRFKQTMAGTARPAPEQDVLNNE